MTDGMATLTGAVPGVDTEPGPDAATTRYDCWDCNLPDLHNGDGDGIGSCNCPRCETCNGAPSTCNCWSDQVRRISGDDDGGDWTGPLIDMEPIP